MKKWKDLLIGARDAQQGKHVKQLRIWSYGLIAFFSAIAIIGLIKLFIWLAEHHPWCAAGVALVAGVYVVEYVIYDRW